MILPCLLLLKLNVVLNTDVNVKIDAFEEPSNCQGFLDRLEVRPLGDLSDNKHSILQPLTNVEG